MLISFSVRNYQSFRERAEWSLIASPDTIHEDDNVVLIPVFGLRLLKSAVVYGANASGKSKLIEALAFMREFVRDSSLQSQQGDPINTQPFRLSTETSEEPSEFEAIFLQGGVLYRYGFTATSQKVVSEWLFQREKTKEARLFDRAGQSISYSRSAALGIVADLVRGQNVRENALLISVAAQFNVRVASVVLNWFENMAVVSGLNESSYRSSAITRTADPAKRPALLALLQEADLGIEDIRVEAFDVEKDELPAKLQKLRQLNPASKARYFAEIFTTHGVYNAAAEPAGVVEFSLRTNESAGTQKFFFLASMLLDVLEAGGILIADELDSRLHPNLVCKIIELFNSTVHNPHHAQLLFNTHDTNLLEGGHFRRDQIWFTEKDRYGASTIYSLNDFKGIRKDDSFERNYIRGKYGAIPYLGNFGHVADQLTTTLRSTASTSESIVEHE